MSLENFKNFVRNKPILENYITKGEKTWQDFYDMYELYGEKNPVWDKYLNTQKEQVTLKDMLGMFKNIDMNEVQKSINSIQKGLGYIEDLVKTKEKEIPIRKTNYEARPLYKYLDD